MGSSFYGDPLLAGGIIERKRGGGEGKHLPLFNGGSVWLGFILSAGLAGRTDPQSNTVGGQDSRVRLKGGDRCLPFLLCGHFFSLFTMDLRDTMESWWTLSNG